MTVHYATAPNRRGVLQTGRPGCKNPWRNRVCGADRGSKLRRNKAQASVRTPRRASGVR